MKNERELNAQYKVKLMTYGSDRRTERVAYEATMNWNDDYDIYVTDEDAEYVRTVWNIKSITRAVQEALFDAILTHDWTLVERCESALESLETVNYSVSEKADTLVIKVVAD